MRATVNIKTDGGRNEARLRAGLATLTRKQVLVGVPATTAMERKLQIMSLAGASKGKKRRARLQSMAVTGAINNAQLVYIHTNGSPGRHIPARPIIEPAITDKQNAEAITDELKDAALAALDGKPILVTRQLSLAGVEAQNRVRKWFTNPRNQWAPNAPSTIRRKGSSNPLIDTGALRQAITYVVTER